MRRHLFDLVALLVIATIVAGYLLLTEPSWRSPVLRVYVFVVGALAMLALVAAAAARSSTSRCARQMHPNGRCRSSSACSAR